MITLIDAVNKAFNLDYDYVAIDDNGAICVFEDEPMYVLNYDIEGENFWDLDDGTKIKCLGTANFGGGRESLLNINDLKL